MDTSLSSKNLTRGYCTVFKSVYCLNFIVLFIGLKKACGRKLTVLYNISLFFRSYMSRKRSILLYTILHIMFLARALNIINSNINFLGGNFKHQYLPHYAIFLG